MSSTFGILESARSGLNAAQLGLNITSQNISNANTDGYTRQALNISAKSPDTGAYRFPDSNQKVGQGVSVDSVYQIRDSFLDVRYRYENSSYNLYNSMNSLMSPIEDKFNEVGATTTTKNKLIGLSGMIDNIITSLQKGQNTPTDTSISEDVKDDLDLLTSTIRNDSKSLKDALDSAKKELSIYVNGGVGDTSDGDISGGINGMIVDIQNLNEEIASYEVTGQKANDLRDQRNLLLDKLSTYMDIDTTEQENGMVSVKLAGDSYKNIIDSDNNANVFSIGTDSTSGATVLQWSASVTPNGTRTPLPSSDVKTAAVAGGTIKAYLNVINGDASGTDNPATGQCGNLGIPYLQKKLNEFAVSLVNIMNNTGGVVNGSDVSGTQFLTYTGYTSSETTADMLNNDVASTIKITDDWRSDPDKFLTNYTGAEPGSYYTKYVLALNKTTGTVPIPTASDGTKVYSGSVRDFADSFTQEIAAEISSFTNKGDAAKINGENLDSQRQAISSVSTNDEGVNIIKYQQAYNANARVITVIDEMLDKLINGTGTTGL
ncbi:MAG TPA: flagellar hook-associated protein FlgK [Ruminiclostridium sp.]|nr:flagellar hook-associated protein FlgK [Ruminiclostridium sp.]